MKKKFILLLGVSFSLILLLGLGVSYSIWRSSNTQEKINTATTSCFDLSISSQVNSIHLQNAYPISDDKGKTLVPFTFTVRNTCDLFASYTVNLEVLKDSTLPTRFVKAMLNSEEIVLLSSAESTEVTDTTSIESHTLARGTLSKEEEMDYTLRLWIDENTTMEDLNNEVKLFKSKIVIKGQPSSYSPVKAGYNKLKDAILANEYQTTPEKAIEKINAKQTVDLTQTAPIITWVEKTGAFTTQNIAKPAPSTINSDAQTSNLTANDTLIILYKTKTFNSETGRYALSNPVYVDPTTLDFNETTNGGIKYYFSEEYINYNITSEKLYTWNGASGPTIYQITGALKTNSTTTWHGTTYDSITYTLNMTTLSETEIESDKSDKGLYAETDRFGTTYYYRGNVKNNNVLFAGYYWQIVRINGDGSIRLLYNGTIPNASGASKTIGATEYNINHNNPAYGGYMFGSTIGTRENNIKNEVNSTIKEKVDAWYKTNVVDKGYASYVSDSGFCNDRSLYEGDGARTDSFTYFSSYNRAESNIAIFTCPNEESDLFTLKSSAYGNKALTYPVGLITYDELVFAGVDEAHLNKLSWAYSLIHYWTMTPSIFDPGSSVINKWFQHNDGYLNEWCGDWFHSIRPVISLNADVEITEGLGTPDNPFVVKTN